MKELSNEEWVQIQCTKTGLNDLENHRDQIFYLMECYTTKKKLTDPEIKEMFDTHNHYLPNAEYGYWCSSCRTSCYKTLVKVLPFVLKEIEKR